MSKWNTYSSDCRISFHKNPTEWGIFSTNLHSEEYSIIISSSDSSDCRILLRKKTYTVGNFLNFLQSEEYSWFHSTSDSSDCSITNVKKATNWGMFENMPLASMSYYSCYKLFCISIATTSHQNEIFIPQIVAFH